MIPSLTNCTRNMTHLIFFPSFLLFFSLLCILTLAPFLSTFIISPLSIFFFFLFCPFRLLHPHHLFHWLPRFSESLPQRNHRCICTAGVGRATEGVGEAGKALSGRCGRRLPQQLSHSASEGWRKREGADWV